jgi:hypothetical protein
MMFLRSIVVLMKASGTTVVRKNLSVTCKTQKSQGFSWSCPIPPESPLAFLIERPIG